MIFNMTDDYQMITPQVVNKLNGSIVNFSDGIGNIPIKDLNVKITPVQNLNGYNYPWSSGNGNQKYDIITNPFEQGSIQSINGQETTGNARIRTSGYAKILPSTQYTVSVTGATGYYAHYYGEDYSYVGNSGGWINNGLSITTPVNALYVRFVLAIDTAPGATVPITPSDISNFMLSFGAVALTWQPYENICPINGWSKIHITRTGINILNALEGFKYCRDHDWNSTIIQVNETTKTITFNSANAGQLFRGIIINNRESSGLLNIGRPSFPFKENTSYTFIFRATSTLDQYNIGIGYTDGSYKSFKPSDADINGFVVFTTPANKTVRSVFIGRFGGVSTFYYEDFGLFEGIVTLEDFKHYNGQTAIFQLNQTIYSGILNVNTGILIINGALVDMSTLNWSYNSVYNLFISTDIISTVKSNTGALCSQYKWIETPNSSILSRENYCFGINKNNAGSQINGNIIAGAIMVKDTTYSDVETFKTSINGTQLYYVLATPLTIQLTPTSILTIQNINNIFANSGDVEVIYKVK